MNIESAKEVIKDTVRIYLKKDEYGDYRIPVVRQRPVFLLGAPGIGKTAIMEQIAQEMGIALVSYSMTHHTRQSALGLPFIKEKKYGELACSVSEYTMSEIIASVYDTMEKSGIREGILFLDEINCVSETLAPSMLQFLQYKVFGRHSVPDGWVIVTAGNPPMYNKSVREFDIVTMDRLKVIEVEADYDTWKIYAADRHVNPAVMGFLNHKKEYFYHIETTAKGRSYITARGWEDLAEMVTMYEEEKLPVNIELVNGYISSEKVAREFCDYYDLYQKYKNDYRADDILAGKAADAAIEKASGAGLDEKLSIVSMLLGRVQSEMREIMQTSDFLTELMTPLRAMKKPDATADMLEAFAVGRENMIASLAAAGTLTPQKKRQCRRMAEFFREVRKNAVSADSTTGEALFSIVKERFDSEVAAMKTAVSTADSHIHNMFEFAVRAFGEENELLIMVTELTAGNSSSRYIATFGCEDYHRYSKLLMISERQNEMRESIASLLD